MILGDFPKLSVKTTRGTGGESLTVLVTEKTAGVPSGKYFSLTMESMPSPLIPAAATAGQVSYLTIVNSVRSFKSSISFQ